MARLRDAPWPALLMMIYMSTVVASMVPALVYPFVVGREPGGLWYVGGASLIFPPMVVAVAWLIHKEPWWKRDYWRSVFLTSHPREWMAHHVATEHGGGECDCPSAGRAPAWVGPLFACGLVAWAALATVVCWWLTS